MIVQLGLDPRKGGLDVFGGAKGDRRAVVVVPNIVEPVACASSGTVSVAMSDDSERGGWPQTDLGPAFMTGQAVREHMVAVRL